MGLGVSTWQLARAIALQNRNDRKVLPVISGVSLERLLPGKLKAGGYEAEEIIKVIKRCPYEPIKRIGESIIDKYWNRPSSFVPVFSLTPSSFLIGLRICSDYVFVTLAKQGHNNHVGINYLEKIAYPHLYAIYGAMLAGVDFILMGAGIPREIPNVIDAYLADAPASYDVPVDGDKLPFTMTFDPKSFLGERITPIQRPSFLPIVASHVLAQALAKRTTGRIDGFVVEGETAGGHNAPPRGQLQLDSRGEPIYGPRDVPDIEKIRELDLPFWLAGSYASPEKIKKALSLGATGVQVGTIFALSDKSGFDPELRRKACKLAFNRALRSKTDPLISPTGFPFKVAEIPGTISDPEVYNARIRICDQGALLRPYRTPNGSIGYRCASEPISDYLNKGGKIEETVGRACICDALIQAIGLRYMCRSNDPAVLTLGDNTEFVPKLMKHENDSYSVEQALDYLFSDPAE